MTAGRAEASAAKPAPDPDPVVLPDPVTQKPPPDRFCDLVLTGGVASGVVYPWAVVELARHFHFKSIGGTSVGAMAAALAAAAEYGRRCGSPTAFEVLRRLPDGLADAVDDEGTTRLQSLFQPAPAGRRLFDVFLDAVRTVAGEKKAPKMGLALRTLRAFWTEALGGALLAVAVALIVFLLLWAALMVTGWLVSFCQWPACCVFVRWAARGIADFDVGHLLLLLLTCTLVATVGALGGLVCGLRHDVRRGIVANDLGLVRGKTQGDSPRAVIDRPALIDWLHDGIQTSAGFNARDRRRPPLTFRDLWNAPESPGAAARAPVDEKMPPSARSINLEMITTNVTHGRPYRLPLNDATSQLYYRPEELAAFFPEDVMQALEEASHPYAPLTSSDPPAHGNQGFRTLPGADMPIVVAARLSLSFPFLFSSIPLYAVDYERERPKPGQATEERELHLCRFSDGGICSNFPVHLFDSAVPRWPTFGLWLDTYNPLRKQSVWLPEHHRAGLGDQWIRIDKNGMYEHLPATGWTLWRFFKGIANTAQDWSDRSGMRMPQARTRVARLKLKSGEGGFNIAMPPETIRRMAHCYGTAAGKAFARTFVKDDGLGTTDAAWREYRWVRLHTLVRSLKTMLRGVGDGATLHNAHSVPLERLIDEACEPERPPGAPLRPHSDDRDRSDGGISIEEAQALKAMLAAARTLEEALDRCSAAQRYEPSPMPELRVRPPL